MLKRRLRIDPIWLCVFIVLAALWATNGGRKLPDLKHHKPLKTNTAYAAEKGAAHMVNPASIPANAGETIAGGTYGQSFIWELADGSHTVVVTQRDGGSVLSKPVVTIDDMYVPDDQLAEVAPSTYKVGVSGWPLKLAVLSLPSTEERTGSMFVSLTVDEGTVTVDQSSVPEPQPAPLPAPDNWVRVKQYYQPGVGMVHDCSLLNAQSINEAIGTILTLGMCNVVDHSDR